MRKCSEDMADASDRDLSRKESAGENRLTDKSRGLAISLK